MVVHLTLNQDKSRFDPGMRYVVFPRSLISFVWATR